MKITNMQRIEIVRACCCVAHADGHVTDEELAQLRRLARAIGIGDASLNAMMDRARQDKEFYKQQFGTLRDDPVLTLDILLESAVASGTVAEAELHVLRGLAQQLGISESDFTRQVGQAISKKQAGSAEEPKR